MGSLPEGYGDFLREGDGTRLTQFNSVTESEFGGVREVFSVADPDGSSRKLRDVMKTYTGRVPTGFIPIADDQAGNLYCLGLTGPDRGKVYF